ICDGNMEQGSFRCDANVSVRKKGSTTFGTRTELKNLNSFKYIEKSLDYEIKRQIEIIKGGGEIIQETRLFNVDEGITYSMRGKEEAHDYRYFPEPDLLPLIIDDAWIERIKKELPELPFAKAERFIMEYGLPRYDVDILVSDRYLADYFEETVKRFPEAKTVSNWIMTELLRELKERNLQPKDAPISPERLGELLSLIKDGTISIKIGKDIFPELCNRDISPKKLVEEKGLIQISDESEISAKIDEILSRFPKEVQEFKSGKEKLLGFFVGQVMKETKGKANPKMLNELLIKRLKD
ncbi:MAG: Asp-tRNA(Asn)/Glu-tRNA(Gln) amidotransferase subunit GatB, partial [Syntrophorhabdaceae bacterium]|nr:Asp-tRNA(Asn)/Glu-tRNA(Gln) amidotransferase subunit GatB [Syntrophorhabdaceae bacterium]